MKQTTLKKGMVMDHKDKPCVIVAINNWEVPNTSDPSQLKAYPPTKFTEVALYNPNHGLSKVYLH